MQQRKASAGVKALFGLFLIFLALLPEIGARVARRLEGAQTRKPFFDRIAEGYELRDELTRDWSVLRFEYHDYYLYAPRQASSELVNFTDYFGARATPASVSEADAEETIWAFGGSTMQNLEAVDALTLANRIVVELNERGIPSRLHNLGVGAFQSSLELIRFQDLLRRVPESQRPTTTVFYDGFNDAAFGYLFGAGSPQSDVSSKLADLIDRSYARLAVYSASEWLSERSVFWDRFVGTRIEMSLHGPPAPDGSAQNLSAAVRAYTVNVRAARGICAEFRIRCLFFLQPLLATRSPLTPLEEEVIRSIPDDQIEFARSFYARVAEELVNAPDFHDLSRFYDGRSEPVFFDFGHTSPLAGIPLGKEIASAIISARE